MPNPLFVVRPDVVAHVDTDHVQSLFHMFVSPSFNNKLSHFIRFCFFITIAPLRIILSFLYLISLRFFLFFMIHFPFLHPVLLFLTRKIIRLLLFVNGFGFFVDVPNFQSFPVNTVFYVNKQSFIDVLILCTRLNPHSFTQKDLETVPFLGKMLVIISQKVLHKPNVLVVFPEPVRTNGSCIAQFDDSELDFEGLEVKIGGLKYVFISKYPPTNQSNSIPFQLFTLLSHPFSLVYFNSKDVDLDACKSICNDLACLLKLEVVHVNQNHKFWFDLFLEKKITVFDLIGLVRGSLWKNDDDLM
ncbi:hypothetical protein RCL1_007671 [Eukaryota sp. TZLM3-RCL]